jgi:hypothetical protein
VKASRSMPWSFALGLMMALVRGDRGEIRPGSDEALRAAAPVPGIPLIDAITAVYLHVSGHTEDASIL